MFIFRFITNRRTKFVCLFVCVCFFLFIFNHRQTEHSKAGGVTDARCSARSFAIEDSTARSEDGVFSLAFQMHPTFISSKPIRCLSSYAAIKTSLLLSKHIKLTEIDLPCHFTTDRGVVQKQLQASTYSQVQA